MLKNILADGSPCGTLCGIMSVHVSLGVSGCHISVARGDPGDGLGRAAWVNERQRGLAASGSRDLIICKICISRFSVMSRNGAMEDSVR